jgi:hypothetical protein
MTNVKYRKGAGRWRAIVIGHLTFLPHSTFDIRHSTLGLPRFVHPAAAAALPWSW